MIRRLWLVAALLGAAGQLSSPARAQAVTDRAKVQLVDASVEADEVQYKPGSFVCVGKVVLRAKMQGNPTQTITITADKATVKLGRPKDAKTTTAFSPGPLESVLAEGQVHYDVLVDDQPAAASQQVVGDCQKMNYTTADQLLVLSNADQPVVSVITSTRRATPENKLDKDEVTTINLTARRTLQIGLRDEPATTPPTGK